MEKISEFKIPMHLVARDVVLLAKEARENGTLQAMVNPCACQYWDNTSKTQCAIGQAFTPEVAERLQDYLLANRLGHTVEGMINGGVVTTDDRQALTRLQEAHDYIGLDRYFMVDPKSLARFDTIVEEILTELPED